MAIETAMLCSQVARQSNVDIPDKIAKLYPRATHYPVFQSLVGAIFSLLSPETGWRQF